MSRTLELTLFVVSPNLHICMKPVLLQISNLTHKPFSPKTGECYSVNRGVDVGLSASVGVSIPKFHVSLGKEKSNKCYTSHKILSDERTDRNIA